MDLVSELNLMMMMIIIIIIIIIFFFTLGRYVPEGV